MIINSTHKEMTDEQSYENQKKLYRTNPLMFMHPKKWKKMRIEILNKNRQVWSK